MRYAVFSDLHGNLPAWKAVYADIVAQGAETIVCLGDVVGYGPRPQEALDEVRKVTENFVLGNHDAAACGRMDPSIFNDNARAIVEWTTTVLSEDALHFLNEVPLTMEDGSGALFVHAEIEEPGRFGYILEQSDAEENFAATDAEITFIGHTHQPAVFTCDPQGMVTSDPVINFQRQPGCRYIINVGSSGEPRDYDVRASYCIYDDETRQIEFRRVKFDVEAYRADLRSVGLNINPFFLQAYDDFQAGAKPLVLPKLPQADHTPVVAAVARRKESGTRRIICIPPSAPSLSREKAIPIAGTLPKASSLPNKGLTQAPQSSKSFWWTASLIILLLGTCLGFWFYSKRAEETSIVELTKAHTDIVLTKALAEESTDLSATGDTQKEERPPRSPSGLIFHTHLDYPDQATALRPIVGGSEGTPHQGLFRSTEGKFGKAMLSSAMKNGAQWPQVQNFAPTDSFTISGWIWREKKGGGTIVAKALPNGTRGYRIFVKNRGRRVAIEFHLVDNRKNEQFIEVSAGPQIPEQKWIHAAVTYNGSGKIPDIRIFIDGRICKTQQRGVKTLSGGFESDSPLRIGSAGGRTDFKGKIDEVILFKRVLAEKEIRHLANLDN